VKQLGYEFFMCENELEPLSCDPSQFQVTVCNSIFLNNDIKKFTNLKMIQLTSSGFDRVPVHEIKRRGIVLSNARGVYSVPIAEWVVLKILEVYKRTRFFEEAQRRLQWTKNRDLLELAAKTIGIIGTGSVGMEVAKRVQAFGCTVLGVNSRGVKEKYFDECVPTKELNSFFTKCDVIVLTLPLTDSTKNLINKDTLSFMREDAVLVNVSRGGIINEKELIDHLNEGKLRGVALDVFEQEPVPNDSLLWKHERVLATPHNSFVSDNVSVRMFDLIYQNLKAFIENRPIKNQI
jgi:phosphoglycerate dehydrogenase-like enzyme